MNIKIIDQSFLLDAYSLTKESRSRVYPIILVDARLKESIFVMVKAVLLVSNNEYEVII